jgi:hypothetical protein
VGSALQSPRRPAASWPLPERCRTAGLREKGLTPREMRARVFKFPHRPPKRLRHPSEVLFGPHYALTSTMKSGSKSGFSLMPPRA